MWGSHGEFLVDGNLREVEWVHRLPHIKVPTLILVGDHDESDPAMSGEMSAKIAGSKLVVLPTGSHDLRRPAGPVHQGDHRIRPLSVTEVPPALDLPGAGAGGTGQGLPNGVPASKRTFAGSSKSCVGAGGLHPGPGVALPGKNAGFCAQIERAGQRCARGTPDPSFTELVR